jgi:hypothetical protein
MDDAADGAAPRQRPALLVFVHVPKTAGSTLRSVLNMNEPGPRSRALGNVFKGGGGIDRTVMARMQKGEGPDLAGVGIVRGHFPLGIREFLPDHLPKRRELQCFTFLRDPVERILSHYYAIRDRREGEDEAGKYALSALPPEPTLDDALAAGYVHDNLHTRMLCGDPEPFGEVTEEMLAAAKRNLSEELVVFGLTERFDESLVLAKRRLDLRAILYRSSGRVNPERPRGDEVPAELRRTAESANRYDIELYRHAKELFESELESRDLEFEADLAALKAAKTEGELEVTSPVPESFGGDEKAWAMLVRANATAQRADWDRSRHRLPHVPPTVQVEALTQELKAARSEASGLEREVERLRAGTELSELRQQVKKLEREIESLKGARSDAKRLQREVDGLRGGAELKAARSRAAQLEEELESFKGLRSKSRRLQQEVDLLKGTRAQAKRLEGEVEHLRAATSRIGELEAEAERLRSVANKVEKLERQLKRMNDLRSRNKELQGEMERLRAASARTADLEKEVARLEALSSRQSRELEQRMERLEAARSRKEKLEQKVERMRAANRPRGIETR